jgi:hypothetical protein
VAVIVWYMDVQLPMKPVPITTEAVSSNLANGEVCNIMVYSIQHFVIIKFVSNLRRVGGFLRG